MLYCKEDIPEVGDSLLVLAGAAEDYLQTAGVPDAARTKATYDLAVKGIVLHWHDHPDGVDNFGPGLRALINQLKFL